MGLGKGLLGAAGFGQGAGLLGAGGPGAALAPFLQATGATPAALTASGGPGMMEMLKAAGKGASAMQGAMPQDQPHQPIPQQPQQQQPGYGQAAGPQGAPQAPQMGLMGGFASGSEMTPEQLKRLELLRSMG